MTFDNQVVWLTGASSGIGEALAYALAERGARLILSARREKQLEAVRAACAHPERHTVVPLDLAEPASLAAATRQVLDQFDMVDVMIHNGGISQRARAVDTQMDIVRRIMEVNYFGTVTLTKALLPAMLARGRGHFVVVSSLAGKVGPRQRSAYAASKHALHGYFDALRAEVHDAGLRVTIACPGYVRTSISRSALTGDGTPHGTMDKNQQHGLAPERCAERILRAVAHEKAEVYIGGKEVLGVYLKRFVPGLFNRIIRHITPT